VKEGVDTADTINEQLAAGKHLIVTPGVYLLDDTIRVTRANTVILGMGIRGNLFDGVEDGHNLGAVIRTVAAFSLGGVVVAGPHPPPLGGAAAKVAAGSLPLVRVAHVGSLGDYARRARDSGFWAYGADRDGEPVAAVELPERLLLCLGAEASGLRSKTRALLDGRLAIPVAPGVESLNLSVAAAILAWEWRRRFPA
jgi:23S rRNA (guanosine2251-2'-O)-methyltransferase